MFKIWSHLHGSSSKKVQQKDRWTQVRGPEIDRRQS